MTSLLVNRELVAESIYVLVDLGILLDEGVGAWNVRFGLVVVVIADEVFDGVVGEELGELARELCGERLVVRDDERRPAGLLDYPRHRVRLPRSRHAQQGLGFQASVEARGELFYGLRLVAGRLVFAVYPEPATRRILHAKTSGSLVDREASRL